MAQFVALRAANRSADVRVPSTTPLRAPAGPGVAPVVGGGTFAAATYFWKIVAINASGTSLPSSEVTTAVALNGSANLTWTAVTGATSYQIWRGTSSGAENHFQTSGTNSFTDTGAAGTAGTIPATDTGSVATGNTQLQFTSDTVVDVDNALVRKALAHHQAVGQYYVTAVNNTAGPVGTKTALPSNS